MLVPFNLRHSATRSSTEGTFVWCTRTFSDVHDAALEDRQCVGALFSLAQMLLSPGPHIFLRIQVGGVRGPARKPAHASGLHGLLCFLRAHDRLAVKQQGVSSPARKRGREERGHAFSQNLDPISCRGVHGARYCGNRPNGSRDTKHFRFRAPLEVMAL